LSSVAKKNIKGVNCMTEDNVKAKDSWVEFITLNLARFSAILLTLMGLLIFYATITRYFFNSPSGEIFETTCYMMFVFVLMGAPWLLRHRKHISVEILVEFVFPNNRKQCNLFTDLLSLPVTIAFFIYAINGAVKHFIDGTLMTGLLEVPKFLFTGTIALCFLLMAIVLIERIYKEIRELRTNISDLSLTEKTETEELLEIRDSIS